MAFGFGNVGHFVAEEVVNIPHVGVFGGDVPVTNQGELRLRVSSQFVVHVLAQRLHPAELVVHVRVGQASAVGHVEAPDAHAAAGRTDRARLQHLGFAGLTEVRLVIEAALHVFEANSGGDCHAIPLIQAEVRNLVTHEFEEVEGEGFVLGFGFLQGEHVNVVFVEPVFDAVLAGAD